jgi:hypothetical protein
MLKSEIVIVPPAPTVAVSIKDRAMYAVGRVETAGSVMAFVTYAIRALTQTTSGTPFPTFRLPTLVERVIRFHPLVNGK